MIIGKIATANSLPAPLSIRDTGSSFKDTLSAKKAIRAEPKDIGFRDVLGRMVESHERADMALRSLMRRDDLSPHMLLRMQYKTGSLLLKEQMLCRVAENSSNSLKSFTQMQV